MKSQSSNAPRAGADSPENRIASKRFTFSAAPHFPYAFLLDAYRPLTFFVGELLLAAAPFLPPQARIWGRRLVHEEDHSA